MELQHELTIKNEQINELKNEINEYKSQSTSLIYSKSTNNNNTSMS